MNNDEEAHSHPIGAGEGAETSAIRTFPFEGTGLRRVLGPLEAQLLEAVWALAPTDASDPAGWTTIGAVCGYLGPDAHYKTTQTVMNRLVEKHLLVRRQDQRAHEYRAAITREDLIVTVTRSVMQGLVQDFGDLALAQLVRTLGEIRPEQLAALEQLARAPTPQDIDAPSPSEGEQDGDTDAPDASY